MTKIQRLYVGGAPAGGFRFTDKGKNVSTANQRVRNTPERSREDRQKDVGKIMKEMRENKDFKEKRKEFESKKENQNENRQQQKVKGAQTTEFLDDLKDAYKAGLFTGGTKTKAFMDKYGLTGTDIAKLRTGIDQGLGTRIGKGGNVLSDLVGDLRAEGILRNFGTPSGKIFKTAQDVFEPGMKKSNMFLPFEDPQNLFEKGANFATQYNPLLNIVSGIFGSSAGQQATYFGRKQGLEGEELDQFAAAVANDRDLYNQMMTTPLMQDYQLNEFRAEANRNMIANRSDPDPISGTQPGAGGGDDSGGSDDGTTDPGSSYTPAPQNTYTFFDPNLGRYRSGTYDEYLQYVTAKDGGIIQLSKGGNDEDPIAENKKVNLRNIIAFIEQNKNARNENKYLRDELANVVTTTDDQISVKNQSQRLLEEEARKLAEEDKLLGDMLKERFTDQEHITELSVQSGDAVKMAEEDQPAKGILNIELPSDSGPALREDLGLMGKIKDSGMSLLMEALRKSDISTGSANQFIEEALNNFVAAGIIPPNTSYDQLTDPFKDLVTREAAMIANSMAKPIDYLEGRDMESMQLPNMSFDTPDRGRVELPMTILKGKEGDESMIRRSTSTVEPTMYEVADGGIIGLKDGGMNDMMQADSLMFRDPSDEGQWEYNV